MPLYASASFNKAVISVPRCCVLPEDMISRLAMQGKSVALSRGATQKVFNNMIEEKFNKIDDMSISIDRFLTTYKI